MAEKLTPTPSELQGPFAVDLRTPHGEGKPEYRVRFILGGGPDAKEQVQQSVGEINQLPDGLGGDELRSAASKIFTSHGLMRVDF